MSKKRKREDKCNNVAILDIDETLGSFAPALVTLNVLADFLQKHMTFDPGDAHQNRLTKAQFLSMFWLIR